MTDILHSSSVCGYILCSILLLLILLCIIIGIPDISTDDYLFIYSFIRRYCGIPLHSFLLFLWYHSVTGGRLMWYWKSHFKCVIILLFIVWLLLLVPRVCWCGNSISGWLMIIVYSDIRYSIDTHYSIVTWWWLLLSNAFYYHYLLMHSDIDIYSIDDVWWLEIRGCSYLIFRWYHFIPIRWWRDVRWLFMSGIDVCDCVDLCCVCVASVCGLVAIIGYWPCVAMSVSCIIECCAIIGQVRCDLFIDGISVLCVIVVNCPLFGDTCMKWLLMTVLCVLCVLGCCVFNCHWLFINCCG